jgi:propionyl-CoA carboxylase alpha chain
LNEAAIVDNSLSLLIEINKKKIKVESSFNLNQKLCSFKVNEEIFYFKINDLINLHTSDVSFLDCRTKTVVVQSTQKDLLKLMPKDVKEDLSKKLISPMPGLIKSVDVIEGQKVKNADQLLIIEAMKMENILKSEKDCVIEKILVKAGDSVSADEELILFKN